MAVDPALSGMTLPATEPYEITRAKIREFRQAIGDSTGAATGGAADVPDRGGRSSARCNS